MEYYLESSNTMEKAMWYSFNGSSLGLFDTDAIQAHGFSTYAQSW